MELSEVLKKLRIEKGYSQEELSEKSGISLRTIQRIENDEGKPREDTLNLLTKALDIPVDYLLGSIASDYPEPQAKKRSRIPWYIISLTIIGIPIGFLNGILFFLLLPDPPRSDDVISIVLFMIALLFSGLGMLLGAFLERNSDK